MSSLDTSSRAMPCTCKLVRSLAATVTATANVRAGFPSVQMYLSADGAASFYRRSLAAACETGALLVGSALPLLRELLFAALRCPSPCDRKRTRGSSSAPRTISVRLRRLVFSYTRVLTISCTRHTELNEQLTALTRINHRRLGPRRTERVVGAAFIDRKSVLAE